MRLGVYVDVPYGRDAAGYSTDQAFLLFVLALRRHFDRLTLLGRVDPAPRRHPYAIPADVDVVPLPHYTSVKHVRELARALPGTLPPIARWVDTVDAVWSLGPHPISQPVAVVASARGKRTVLGVRQHYPDYIRHRLPSGRWLPFVGAAWALEATFRLLARRLPTIAVGPDLARRYRTSGGRVLELAISLVPESEALAERPSVARDGRIELLSVGRLDPEKAPTLLLDLLERLDRDRFRLTIVGSGELEGALRAAASRFGDRVRLLGHVEHGPKLFELYRRSDVFVHTALTEGLPSALLEAQLFGLPAVGTDVGAVRDTLEDGEAGLVVPPRDADALTEAVRRLAADPALARRLAERGRARVADQTLEQAAARAAAFIASDS